MGTTKEMEKKIERSQTRLCTNTIQKLALTSFFKAEEQRKVKMMQNLFFSDKSFSRVAAFEFF